MTKEGRSGRGATPTSIFHEKKKGLPYLSQPVIIIIGSKKGENLFQMRRKIYSFYIKEIPLSMAF